jgi:hypothetical protein
MKHSQTPRGMVRRPIDKDCCCANEGCRCSIYPYVSWDASNHHPK